MSAPTIKRRSKAATVSPRRTPSRSESAPRLVDPIITMNASGMIQSASDSVEHLFGWTPTELFGRNIRVLIPQPRRSALDQYLDRYRLADNEKTFARSYRFDALRKDGSVFPIELSMSRADLPMNAAPFFIGILRDVSRQIDVGEPLTGERARLQHLVTEQTRVLATANLRLHLADRLASLGTLAAGLGHDMNNVLLPVRARLDALEHAGIPAAAVAHVTAVRQSIGYLQHLSDGLHYLTVDPDATTDVENNRANTQLKPWWDQVGPLLRRAVSKHVNLLATLGAHLPAVQIAPHLLTQAVLNLIVNAGEAISKGRRAGRVLIQAGASSDGRTVKLDITDNGIGMTSAVQRRAMDMFFTTKCRGMGTGLGLPLARKVAVQSGGDLEIRSVAGKGTTASLILPTVAKSAGRVDGSRKHQRVAAVSLRDHRTIALVSQILIAGGVELKAGRTDQPGASDLWVTEPTSASLVTAGRWRKRRAGANGASPAIVLLGEPSKRSRRAWTGLDAIVVATPNDVAAIRHAIGEVIGRWTTPLRKKAS